MPVRARSGEYADRAWLDLSPLPRPCRQPQRHAARHSTGLHAGTVAQGSRHRARSSGLPSRRCPSCRHPMRVAVVKGLDAVPIDMDVCPRCQIVWLDSDEVEALPRITSDESISSPEARVRAATIEARLMRARTTREAFARPRGAFWNALAGMFGYPADDNSTVEWRLPLLTAGLATLILGGFIISMIPGAAFMEKWGLLPGEPWRHAGLDWVASAFLHAGFLHFIVSFCFLLIIGKSVENLIGRARCLVLIFTGQIVAGAVHVAFDSHSSRSRPRNGRRTLYNCRVSRLRPAACPPGPRALAPTLAMDSADFRGRPSDSRSGWLGIRGMVAVPIFRRMGSVARILARVGARGAGCSTGRHRSWVVVAAAIAASRGAGRRLVHAVTQAAARPE